MMRRLQYSFCPNKYWKFHLGMKSVVASLTNAIAYRSVLERLLIKRTACRATKDAHMPFDILTPLGLTRNFKLSASRDSHSCAKFYTWSPQNSVTI